MKRRDEVLVGIFLTVAIAIALLGTLWLVRGGLSSGYPLYTKFAWGQNLKPGQPVLLAGDVEEEHAPTRPHPILAGALEGLGDLDHADRTRPIVVGPVEDAILALARLARPDVVEVRAHDDNLVAQGRITPLNERDHVLSPDARGRLVDGRGDDGPDEPSAVGVVPAPELAQRPRGGGLGHGTSRPGGRGHA